MRGGKKEEEKKKGGEGRNFFSQSQTPVLGPLLARFVWLLRALLPKKSPPAGLANHGGGNQAGIPVAQVFLDFGLGTTPR